MMAWSRLQWPPALPRLLGGGLLLSPRLTRPGQPAVASVPDRETEVIARQAQKMEVLGQLTAGVAHDFNNHLQIVLANLELLGSRMGDDAWLRERLEAAMAGVARAARLTRHLLAYARDQRLAPETVDAGALLSDTTEMLRRIVGEAVQVELVAPDGLWPITVDPQQLETALLNLALNARDAMPQGGRLTITAGQVGVTPHGATLPDGLPPGDYLSIVVRDTGAGMTPEQLRRATEPFYTTKPAGQGTGLGLSMVHAFAKQSAGSLTLHSAVDWGTAATLLLPRAAAAKPPGVSASLELGPGELALLVEDDEMTPAATGPALQEAARTPPSPLLVLLTEDDALIRMAAAELIAELGHRVREAADGAEAMLVLREQPVDLLVADLGLPDIDGMALVEQARALRPRLRVIVTTGREAPPGSAAMQQVAWLTKPYDGKALREMIERVTATVAGYATA